MGEVVLDKRSQDGFGLELLEQSTCGGGPALLRARQVSNYVIDSYIIERYNIASYNVKEG